jgi:hypothetical protein
METLLERIQRPHTLRDLVYPPVEQDNKAIKSSENENLMSLLNRITMRRWLDIAQDQLMESITYLRYDVKFIGHLLHCRMCQILLELDVERYLGTRSTWYLNLENSPYLERQCRGCPKERNYHIGSYWEQLQHYRKYGNTNVPCENTIEFILDRAKWAYKIMARQIRMARRLLRLVRAWNFSEAQTQEFQKLYNRLGMYKIALPFEI